MNNFTGLHEITQNINDKNLAMINLLITYCEANVEEPSSESIFDILVGLEQLKSDISELRKILSGN